MSEAVAVQAIGRCWRLGQTRTVLVYEYRVADSFNTRQANRNLEKLIPGVVAQLNQALFQLDTGQEGESVTIGWWGRTSDGKIVRINAENADQLTSIEAGELAEYIIKQMVGDDSVPADKPT